MDCSFLHVEKLKTPKSLQKLRGFYVFIQSDCRFEQASQSRYSNAVLMKRMHRTMRMMGRTILLPFFMTSPDPM